jgi:hypothetical protein
MAARATAPTSFSLPTGREVIRHAGVLAAFRPIEHF